MNPRSRTRRALLIFFVLLGTASLSGVEVNPDLRKIEPLALTSGETAAVAVQGKVMGAPEHRPYEVPVFFHLMAENEEFPGKVQSLGGRTARVHPRLYAGEIPPDAERYISNWPEVAYIEAAKRARPMLDVSRPAVKANVVHSGTGLPTAYTGAGTYVGIVDTGISGSHPDFSGRIASGFSFSPSSNPLQDTDGHGTHVAGIASGDGSRSSGVYAGMAPGSSLLIGKAGTSSFFTTDIIKVMNDILSFAGTTPVAFNLSLGLVTGPHDGTSGFESSINALANGTSGEKRIIAVAAGNERQSEEHFLVTIPSFGFVNIPLSLETGGSLVDIWADGKDRYTVTATLGSDSASAPTGTSATSARGTVSVFNRTDDPPNGATHITVFITASTPSSPATIRLERTRNGGGGKVDAYIDFLDGTFPTAAEAGTISEPANAENVIAVGSFNTKSFSTGNPIPPPQPISSFSSLGPARDGRIKPDIAAPGYVLYSTRAKEAPAGNYWEIVPGFDNNYAVLAGTSMASPHVAGIAALAWESNPLLTSAQMRERLKRTATPVTPSPDTTWGYGKADALAAVSASVASITAPTTAVPGAVVTLTSEKSSGAFGNPLSFAWELTSRPTGSAAMLSSLTAASTSFAPDTPGEYAVSLTVSQSVPSGMGTAEAIIRVNNVPTAAIAGPASDNVDIPVTFAGTTSSDPDGQPLQFRWVLVSRPAGSSAALLPAGSDNALMTPDTAGTYEIGLWADDGLDNSVLATKTFTALGTPAASSGGGGGGCSIRGGNGEGDGFSALASLFLLLSPLGVLLGRRRR